MCNGANIEDIAQDGAEARGQRIGLFLQQRVAALRSLQLLLVEGQVPVQRLLVLRRFAFAWEMRGCGTVFVCSHAGRKNLKALVTHSFRSILCAASAHLEDFAMAALCLFSASKKQIERAMHFFARTRSQFISVPG